MYNGAYDNPDYRKKQSEITARKWREGVFAHKVRPLVARFCARYQCQKTFYCKPYELKRFCGSSCAAIFRNTGRPVSEETRLLKSALMKLKPIRHKGEIRLPRQSIICKNLACKKVVELPPYLARKRRYCSNACVMQVVGHQTTSPKASKGKPGIRTDINPEICFYSTWEANIARVFNLVELKWNYAPKIFDLGGHTYRPDFYLPDFDEYIEVKNFMSDYSANRDKSFREKYPGIKLLILSKDIYHEIRQEYKEFVDNWEK